MKKFVFGIFWLLLFFVSFVLFFVLGQRLFLKNLSAQQCQVPGYGHVGQCCSYSTCYFAVLEYGLWSCPGADHFRCGQDRRCCTWSFGLPTPCIPSTPSPPTIVSPQDGYVTSSSSVTINFLPSSNWGNTCQSITRRYQLVFRESPGNCGMVNYLHSTPTAMVTEDQRIFHFVVSNLQPGKTYCYGIRAIADTSGSYGFSGPRSIRVVGRPDVDFNSFLLVAPTGNTLADVCGNNTVGRYHPRNIDPNVDNAEKTTNPIAFTFSVRDDYSNNDFDSVW
ncbi:hypothetical protein D6810_00340, partial [Candidatus Dojkabacteria bacterium]